jgi:hypothetical protein
MVTILAHFDSAHCSLLASSIFSDIAFNRPDDDGSFRRTNRRDEKDNYQPSPGDSDDNWRRGGGGGGFRDDRGSRGFDDRRGGYDRRGGGFDERGQDRRGGGGFEDRGYDRRGGGGYEDRGQDRRGGGDFEDRGRMDRKSGYDNRDRGNWRGGGGYDNSNNREGGRFDRRGGYDDDRGFERSSKPGPQGSSTTGSRPRLQLKARTEPVPQDSNKGKPTNDNSGNDHPPLKDEVTETPVKDDETQLETTEKKDIEASNDRPDDEEKKRREPEVVNSRAAAMGAAPNVNREVSNVKNSSVQINVLCFLFL